MKKIIPIALISAGFTFAAFGETDALELVEITNQEEQDGLVAYDVAQVEPLEIAAVEETQNLQNQDCDVVYGRVAKRFGSDASSVLQIVAEEVSKHPSCSCEIVKAAIITTSQSESGIRNIVRTAIENAPGQMQMIAQCATAVAPEAISVIQSVLAEYDPQSGVSYSAKGYSPKSSKGGAKDYDYDIGPRSQLPELSMPSPLDGPAVARGPGSYAHLPVNFDSAAFGQTPFAVSPVSVN